VEGERLIVACRDGLDVTTLSIGIEGGLSAVSKLVVQGCVDTVDSQLQIADRLDGLPLSTCRGGHLVELLVARGEEGSRGEEGI